MERFHGKGGVGHDRIGDTTLRCVSIENALVLKIGIAILFIFKPEMTLLDFFVVIIQLYLNLNIN